MSLNKFQSKPRTARAGFASAGIFCSIVALLAALSPLASNAQGNTNAVTATNARPVNPFASNPETIAATAKDYQRMLALLHVSPPTNFPPQDSDPTRPPHTHADERRPGNWTDDVPGRTIVRSGWGNWSNYEESKAERGHLPDPLKLKNGRTVENAEEWWKLRRPEILADFTSEIYGAIPAHTPKVTWQIASNQDGFITNAVDGSTMKIKIRTLAGLVDNSSFTNISVTLKFIVTTPAEATNPVPLIIVAAPVFGRGFGNFRAPTGNSAHEQLLLHGWGHAQFDTGSVQADNGAGLTNGIIGLCNRGAPRQAGDWGVLAAWSWGLSRAMDFLEGDALVDAKRVGLEGHSRWGKEALLAMALDTRFAIAYSSCSGEGGAKLHRHDMGESVDNVAGQGEYHWMAGNFLKYAGHWDELPVDAHELIGLCAPRPVFITGGTQDLWSDPSGEFKACVAAGPVYRLLGKHDLGVTEMPKPDEPLMSGDLAFRLHAGGHTDVPDWPVFIAFADKYFSSAAK